ncbi:MAG: hypothetical protein ABSB37_06835 [Xanthobacteraceae bacterium]
MGQSKARKKGKKVPKKPA